MGGRRPNSGSTTFAAETSRFGQSSGGGDHVVDHQHRAAFNVTDQVPADHFLATLTTLVDNGQISPQGIRVEVGRFDVANIGGHQREIAKFFSSLFEATFKDGNGRDMVDGNIEESLNLGCVQIKAKDPIRASFGQHVGHQLRGDGDAAFVLTILTGVAKVGNHRGDAAGARTTQAVDPDKQFHQSIVDRLAGRLDDKTVSSPDVLLNTNNHLTIREAVCRTAGHPKVQVLRHALGKLLAA